MYIIEFLDCRAVQVVVVCMSNFQLLCSPSTYLQTSVSHKKKWHFSASGLVRELLKKNASFLVSYPDLSFSPSPYLVKDAS